MRKKGLKVKIRRRWRINPRTRIREDKKVYSRKKAKEELSQIIGEECET